MSDFFEDGKLFQKHMAADPPLPRVVQLELTADCNLRCVFCPVHCEERKRESHERRIEIGDLQTNLLPLLQNAYEVELTGFGEICCHPQLIDILRFFKSLGLTVNATSNGTLWQNELLATIVDEGLIDLMCVSLDAGTADTYRKLRVGGDFDRVAANMNHLRELKESRQTDKPVLHVSFLSLTDNLAELPQAIRLAKSVGASCLVVQGLYENEAMRFHSTGYTDEEKTSFQQAAELANDIELPLEFWYQSPTGAVTGPAVRQAQVTGPTAGDRPMIKDCPYPWERVFVKSNLDVQVCATLWEKLVMGNLRRQSIEEIWHGTAYRDLRRQLAGTDPPAECLTCNTKPWKRPRTIDEMRPTVDFAKPPTHQLGQGFYPVEDSKELAHRWTERQCTFFLANTNQPFLDIDLHTHPRRRPTLVTLLINGREIDRFRTDQIRQSPMRLALPWLEEAVLQVDLVCEESFTPAKIGAGQSRRPLGLMLVGARLAGDFQSLSPVLQIGKNCAQQVDHGFYSPEEGTRGRTRWTGDRASFLLGSGRGEYAELLLWTPGKPRRQRVSVLVDGREDCRVSMPDQPGRKIVRVRLLASRRWHVITLASESLWVPGNGDHRQLGVMLGGARVVRHAKPGWWRRR